MIETIKTVIAVLTMLTLIFMAEDIFVCVAKWNRRRRIKKRVREFREGQERDEYKECE